MVHLGQVTEALQRVGMVGPERGLALLQRLFVQRHRLLQLPGGMVRLRQVIHALQRVGVVRPQQSLQGLPGFGLQRNGPLRKAQFSLGLSQHHLQACHRQRLADRLSLQQLRRPVQSLSQLHPQWQSLLLLRRRVEIAEDGQQDVVGLLDLPQALALSAGILLGPQPALVCLPGEQAYSHHGTHQRQQQHRHQTGLRRLAPCPPPQPLRSAHRPCSDRLAR
jgi:hypothetical protein